MNRLKEQENKKQLFVFFQKPINYIRISYFQPANYQLDYQKTLQKAKI